MKLIRDPIVTSGESTLTNETVDDGPITKRQPLTSRRNLLAIAAGTALAGVGIAVGKRRLIESIETAVDRRAVPDSLQILKRQASALIQQDCDAIVANPTRIEELRTALLAHVWRSGSPLPTDLPCEVEHKAAETPIRPDWPLPELQLNHEGVRVRHPAND